MGNTVRIHCQGKTEVYDIENGRNLYAALENLSLPINAQCGGNGTCGKCLVRVGNTSESTHNAPPADDEKRMLSESQLTAGYRLACRTSIFNGMEVYIPDAVSGMKIASHGKRRALALNPIVAKTFLSLVKPSLDDQSSDLARLEKEYATRIDSDHGPECRKIGINLSLSELCSLAGTLRTGAFSATVVSINGCVTAVEPGDTTAVNYGVAFDIGTTSVVGYLIDLNTGLEAGVYSVANPQHIYGSDVITRISHTMNDAGKLAEMNRSIIDGINLIISSLAEKAAISINDIYAATFAGNTTMMHFLMNIPAEGIASAPFIPVTTKMHFWNTKDLGIRINSNGTIVVLPSVSAYIGADTVAAVLSSGMYEHDSVSLLIDIGTNGEIVLGNRECLYSCSAAAGPAFEGARIRNGISSINGAIDRVKLIPDYGFTTIGGANAVGICGSGIVDAVAELLVTGIIDENGTFTGDVSEEITSDLQALLKEKIIKINGQSAFLLAKQEECAAGTDIAITQRDVRELQNAKAAIAAGIRILSKESGISLEDVKNVYLAGGFGSYIDIGNALKIGLLPKELEGRIEAVGNAAGIGAVECLLSWKMLKEADTVKSRIKYIELSSSKDFMDLYVDSMEFG